MNMNDYQLSAMRTASGMDKRYPMILNGVLGLSGESGIPRVRYTRYGR